MKLKLFSLIFCLSLAQTAMGFAKHRNHSENCDGGCDRSHHVEWDYIIVGDGTAGATLATKLSDNCKNSVLVLEAGQNYTDDPIITNGNILETIDAVTYDPRYSETPIVPITFPGFPEQRFIYSEGRTWGGSSAHNDMMTVRGTPSLYDSWAEISGFKRWDYNHLLRLMRKMEGYTANGTIPDPEQRGLFGPLKITQTAPIDQDPFLIAVSQATDTPFIPDYNNPNFGDVGISALQQYNTPAIRSFSANAFQVTGETVDENGRGLHGRKLRIISNALVSRVLFDEKKRAVGVEVQVDGGHPKTLRVHAKKKVILSAGTIRTAAILERSGIGNKQLLKSLEIPVVVDNPHVGEHLKNHYGATSIFLGATSAANPLIIGFIDNSPAMPNDGTRRIQLVGLNALIGSPPTTPSIILFGVLLDPRSEGSCHIVSRNPTIQSEIDFNLFSDGGVNDIGSDAYNIVGYLKQLPQIAAQTSSLLISPPPEVYQAGDEALLNYTKTLPNLFITYHAAGSCRMSRCQDDGVVDGRLHVHGVKNLMCVDCSIEPKIQDGNTAYGAYLIGLTAAGILADE